jgi:hypothetical protein
MVRMFADGRATARVPTSPPVRLCPYHCRYGGRDNGRDVADGRATARVPTPPPVRPCPYHSVRRD